MSSRFFIWFFGLLLCTCCMPPVYAQKSLNVLDWKTDVSLNTHLLQQMHEQYAQRQEAFKSALANPEATQVYIQQLRQKFKQLIGELPLKADLNVQVTGTLMQSGYRIEKVLYQSFPNHHVSANLYIPEGSGKFPAVLLFCGHEDVSKATPSYQQTARLLAKNGFVVLVVDPISQSERVQLTDENGKSLTRGSTTEHTLLNLQSNLLSTSVAAYELFDNVRGLDYLQSRAEVDTDKIGCIGNSGGAIQAIYFAAFDERVKVIVPCSYLARRERTFELSGAADGCAQIPLEGAYGFEMSDYLIAAAPKPILVLAGRFDFIDYNSTLAAYQDLKDVYQRLSAPEKLSMFSFDDGHGISKPKREKAVQWFRKWFYGDANPVVEDEWQPQNDVALFSSNTGKVSTAFSSEQGVVQYNQALYQRLHKQRSSFANATLAQRQAKVEELLGLDKNTHPIAVERLLPIQHKGLNYHKIIIRRAGEVPLPALVYYPEKPAKKVLLVIGDEGKNALADTANFINTAIEAGNAVVLADVRGTGETTDKLEMNDPKYYSKDYRTVMLALHMGKPIVAQRVQDIQTLVDFIQSEALLKNADISLRASGNTALAALHATFLYPVIKNLTLNNTINSYQQVLDNPLVKDRYALVIPGVLAYYDLPDMVKWIGEKRVTFR